MSNLRHWEVTWPNVTEMVIDGAGVFAWVIWFQKLSGDKFIGCLFLLPSQERQKMYQCKWYIRCSMIYSDIEDFSALP